MKNIGYLPVVDKISNREDESICVIIMSKRQMDLRYQRGLKTTKVKGCILACSKEKAMLATSKPELMC